MKLDVEKLLMEVPITRIKHIKDNDVYVLLEKFNMCWSIKVKTVYWILKEAIKKGNLDKQKTILEASSGNTAISLAYLSNLFDIKIKLVVPESTASCKKKLIKSYWAELIEVSWVTDDAIELRDKIYKENPNKYFLTDQYNNYDNLNAHYYLTWPHIIDRIWEVDFFVAGLWTCWTLIWTAKYLKEKNPNTKIIWINPIDKIEWIKNYSKVRNIGKIYNDFKYLIDEVINVEFEKDAIVWVNDYIWEWYFNWISSWAILSWTKKYLEWKSWLTWAIIAPDWWDYYFAELMKCVDKSKIEWCK